jgi:hypothetical protein
MENATLVSHTFNEQVRNVKTMRLGELLFFIQLFILISNGYLFPNAELSWQVCITYMLIPIGFMIYSKRNEQLVQNVPLYRSLVFGLLGFWVTFALVIVVYGLIFRLEFGTVAQDAVWSTIALQAIFVAPCEEIAFRLIMPEWLKSIFPKNMWFVAIILSQVAFSLFHLNAYSGGYFSLLLAFIVGMIWVTTSRLEVDGKPIGIGMTIGSHMCYNLILTGVLVGNIGGI